LELEYLSRHIPPDKRLGVRDHILEQLIDRRLIEQFLQSRKVEAPQRELDRQLALLRRIIEHGEGDFETTIARLGFTEESLRKHLALPLAWQAHVRRVVTDQRLREYFAEHQARFDGTEVRASQIVVTLDADAGPAAWDEAEQSLRDVRQRILDGQVTFAAAARQHSTAPSGRQGGDLGYFPYRGRLPADIASAAFALQPGEIGQPFRSTFGVHLVTATDRKPGSLSLEDARDEVWEQLAAEMWDEQVRTERAAAKIEWQTARAPAE
jgi:parvulin-like peptidyl-prolyl isomerase